MGNLLPGIYNALVSKAWFKRLLVVDFTLIHDVTEAE